MNDPRLLLERNGRAAAGLEGLRPADQFLATRTMGVIVPSAPLRAGPGPGAEQFDQLLFGEAFEVLETEGDWAFGQARRDGYVGWTPIGALAEGRPSPTHRVSSLRTFALAEPQVRAAAWGPLSMNALVRVEAVDGRFALATGAGWIAADHLAPIGVHGTDLAEAALRFVGAPYLWGGRDSLGLDCSGLVQQAFYACGRSIPRDSNQQERLGHAVAEADLRRNDLVFWQGHVGLMTDSEHVIHANGWHMAAAVEPLAEAVARIEAIGGGRPTAFRRV